ncbi:type 2 DNA topoisomerase 6 subunit B-like isoform X5 [Lagenorhynchus albirostris]|uniref:type 2 DNA topoisomerase 6 subunit B-like isoform X5 n=1 Tax=Lagenorhynchus albirostris TaxID=27610 RepID=UPI0028E55D96|nr:type 2 DNA topoisomerase 6 subunit B-like isoform X5 [Lagenorhynchus albirostris]
MEGTAVAVCEILKYLIIHWKCETARIPKGALLEGELVISIEALNSKHQANTLHCVTTIASAGSIFGGLVLKKILKEIQSILPGLSAELSWTSEETSYSQDVSGVTPFQMIFEVHEKPRTLMTDSLVIKNFLRKVITVLPKIRFNFSVKVNGILSMEIFGAENEPTLNLSNGIALVINHQHYVSTPKFGATELLCSRIHPVLGHPVMLFIPDDVAKMGLLGELILTPAAALCPCPKVFSNQLNRISSVYIFLYGPSGLPLILLNPEQPTSTIFKDTSYFINWKKHHLCMVPNLDFNLDRGVHTLLTTHLSAILTESHSVVQDSIQVAVDQALEQHHHAVKAHQKLQASLSVAVNSIMSIMTGSTSSSFRKTCLQTLQAADTQEFGTKLHKSFHEITQNRFLHHCSREVKQAAEGGSSLTTGVCSSQEFGSPSEPNVSGEQVDGRKCLSMGPAGWRQEPGSRCASLGLRTCGSIGVGLWLALRVADPRLLLGLPGPEAEAGVQQLLPEKNNAEQSTEDAHENSSLELLAGTSGQVENKSLKRGSLCQGVEETRAFRSPRALNPSEAALGCAEPTAAPLTPSRNRTGPRSGLEDALWLQEISNLSEWLSPGSAS